MLAKYLSIIWILTTSTTSEGLLQEFVLYENATNPTNGHQFIIRHSVEDATPIFQAAPWRSLCLTGFWVLFSGQNFTGTPIPFSSKHDRAPQCHVGSAGDTKSIRFGGARETNTPAISIYSSIWYQGTETFTSRPALAALDGKSFLVSGLPGDSWRLFEGTNFDGPSVCFAHPDLDTHVGGRYDVMAQLNLTKIGSLYRGCDCPQFFNVRQYIQDAPMDGARTHWPCN